MKNVFTFCFLFCAMFPISAVAQALVEQDITWNSDGFSPSKCRFSIFKAAEGEIRGKTHIVVIKELAENQGKTTVEDAKFLAEKIATTQNIEIESIFFVHLISGTSFDQGRNGRKAIMLGTSFRRQENGRINAPSWRIVSLEDAIAYTDRQFKL